MISDWLRSDNHLLDDFRRQPWKHYREQKIAKPDGTDRTLFIPSASLKAVQRRILREVLINVAKHDSDHARAGRSVITNAQPHLNHGFVSSYDIEHCFPNVTPRLVTGALLRSGMSEEKARIVTELTTYRGQLPQGTPTSSALLSAVLFPLDTELALAARRHGITYTRYVDDIFISGNKSVRFFRREVLHAVTRWGLRLAHDKTTNWTPERRARLAGVVLASKPTSDPEYVESVRALIRRVSLGQLPLSKSEHDSLRGRIAWIEQLRPSLGRLLKGEFLRDHGVRMPPPVLEVA